jgi:hypothetical protein
VDDSPIYTQAAARTFDAKIPLIQGCKYLEAASSRECIAARVTARSFHLPADAASQAIPIVSLVSSAFARERVQRICDRAAGFATIPRQSHGKGLAVCGFRQPHRELPNLPGSRCLTSKRANPWHHVAVRDQRGRIHRHMSGSNAQP